MLVTAFILVFLYRQDRIAGYEQIAALENERTVSHLSHLLSNQIAALIAKTEGFNTKALQSDPNVSIFSAELEKVREPHIVKLKLYNLSGTTVYSSENEEIGGSSIHPEALLDALRGGVVNKIEYHEDFSGLSGMKKNVYVALTYMPLTFDGKRIGAIELDADATPIMERIRRNTISIIMIVFGAFATLFAALFFAVRKTDHDVIEWQNTVKNALDELKYQKFALDQHLIVGITDVQGTITYANERFSNISGYTYEELLGQNHRLLNSGVHPREFFREMYRTIAAGNVWSGEICNRAKNGQLYWVDTTIVPFMSELNKPTQYISMRTDITARKLAEAEIHDLAYYDTLTKLPNRRVLYDRLFQAMAASRRTGHYCALMFIDLDHFKQLNDTHGHVAGDMLLIEVSNRLKRCVREVDTVSRFGGDEFVVMLNDLDEGNTESISQARLVADKILTALSKPFVLSIKGKGIEDIIVEHHCTASIGVVVFTSNDGSQDDILMWADSAMYQAKHAGRNTIKFHDPSLVNPQLTPG